MNIDRQDPLQHGILVRVDDFKIRMNQAQPSMHAGLGFSVHQESLIPSETVDQEFWRAIPNQVDAAAIVF